MKLTFDPEVDALYLVLAEGPVLESEEVAPGVILDFDEHENVVAIEVLRVSRRARQVPEQREVAAPLPLS